MTDQDKQNIAAVRKAYQEGSTVIAPNIVWHVPGNNPVSGVYKGVKAYLEDMVSRMAPIEEWVIDVEDVMVNGNMAVATLQFSGLRKGHRVKMGGAHVMRLENGKVVEGWGFSEDQDVLDQFFSA
jgi:ketosteroid isomerase-like protein